MRELILRNTPLIASVFRLETMDSAAGKNVYEIEGDGEKVILRGDTPISQAMAYYRYLEQFCGVNLSHCANTTIRVDKAVIPQEKITHVIEQQKRAYLNYCTYGYSLCWWDWERWEKEIDFMAMRGINMPLSIVGTEAVWYYTLLELGYTEDGALNFLSGPAFWPWQLMTNIDSYFSLTDKEYIQSRITLGKKIIDRQISLGMTPIQQGFTGHVPKTLIRLFPKAQIRHIKSWCAFPITYQIDPTDPAFKKVGTIFMEKQRQLFGAHHYYASDPFHENEPPTKDAKYLWNVGRAISQLYESFDQSSTWVMQSWSLREQIVKAVDKDRLLILDINGEKYKETNGFWGYPFVLGTLHNFGDRNSLHGSIGALAKNPFTQVRAQHENVVGTGLFMEGIMQNPLYYDLAFHMLTQNKAQDLNAWLADYAQRRWGSDEPCLVEAARALHESCYSDKCTGRETGSAICARPSTNWRHTAPNDNTALRYDNRTLLDAALLLLQAKRADTDGYRYDVCDITRQVLSNFATTLYQKSMEGYHSRDIRLFERSCNTFLKIIGELDDLLATRPELNLAEHLQATGKLALTDQDKQNFEINLLSQLTVWGPVETTELYDYAWKEWSGLLEHYYGARWRKFYERLAGEFKRRRPFSTDTKKQTNERDAYQGDTFQKNLALLEKNFMATYRPKEDDERTTQNTLTLARGLLDKYAPQIREG